MFMSLHGGPQCPHGGICLFEHILVSITHQHHGSCTTGASYGEDYLIRFKSPRCINLHTNVEEEQIWMKPLPHLLFS